LLTNNPFPEINLPSWEWNTPHPPDSQSNLQQNLPDRIETSDNPNIPPNQERPDSELPNAAGMIRNLPLLRVVGQVALAYIIAEGPDGLYLIDQHAAHERVLFEKLANADSNPIHSQPLLDPMKLDIPASKVQLFNELIPTLAQLGFAIEPFGGSYFRVRAIPALLTGADPIQLVRSVVEEFEEDETPLAKEMERRLAARICKRAAVKAGKSLTIEEQKRLIEDLEACDNPRTCPHGRPTMIHLSATSLERQFGRRGSL
jgi:DNA mismatch repair protein MutL